MFKQGIRVSLLFISLILFLLLSSSLLAQDPFARIVFDDRAASKGVGWADYDNDGYPDIYVTNGAQGYKQQNFLYHNNGDGTFTRITTGPQSQDQFISGGCTWGDFDNDGDLDLYVATTVDNFNDPNKNNFLYVNNGDGTFTKNTTAGPPVDDKEYTAAVGWGDYNNDGFVDLFIKNGYVAKQANSLYSNDSDGTFSDITGIDLVSSNNATFISGFSWGDYNNDGRLDLCVAGGAGPNNAIWRNDGNNTFVKLLNESSESIIEGSDSSGPSWADYDNDGDLDMYMTNFGDAGPEKNFLYRNDGNDIFTKILNNAVVNDSAYSLGCAWGDIDNDGDLDLFVGNDDDGSPGWQNFLYLNNGDGTFTKNTNSVVLDSTFTYGAAFADYNKDGFIDLFTCREGKSILFMNNGVANGNTNHWINIQCVGTTSNKAGIGAKVRVKATLNSTVVWQMREICAQSGYGSHNDLRAHFGLADATLIDELKIEWPSGNVQTLTNVAVNQFLTITESGSAENIRVTAPNGGETWQVGSVHDITWTSSNTSGQVDLEYSTDGGSNWSSIANDETDDGSYSWTIPDVASTNCLVRITDADGNPSDVSDSPFTIAQVTYVLTMAIDPSGSGSTDPSEGDHNYEDGTVVTIVAIPLTGYEFSHWTGDVEDPNNDTTTVTMNDNKLVTAHFSQRTSTLTMVVDPTGGGTTDPAPGTHIYPTGQVVTVIANPANGYQFSNWTGDVADPNDDTTTVTMNTDKTVTANFEASSSFITITAPNGGEDWEVATIHNITWTSENTSGTVKLEYSTDNGSNWTEIIASTADDGVFAWTIPNDPSTNCLVRVTDTDGDPTDVSDAVFTISPISYTLTMAINPAQGGTTDPAVGDHSYSQGTVVNIIATAATGYQFVNWTGGDVADPNNDTTTATMNTDKTVTANFALIPIVDSKASIVGENILLEWSPSLATTIYNVYRDTLYNFEPDTVNGTNRIGYHVSDEDPATDGVQWTDTGNGAQIVGDVDKNYFYKVTAVADVESAPSSIMGEFDYRLITTSTTDINEIVVIMNTQNGRNPILTAEDLINAIPYCSDAYYWNASGQGTVGHPKGVPFNNFTIYPGYPYIVNVTENTVWTVAGTYSDTSFQLITTDITDINHLAVPLSKDMLTTAEELGQDIPHCSDVYFWNAEGQGTTGHVMGLPFNNFAVRAGYPYYVNVTSATVWPGSGEGSQLVSSMTAPGITANNTKSHVGQGVAHTVYGTLSYPIELNQAGTDWTVKAWIIGRANEILSDDRAGCGCDGQYWWIGVSDFATAWQVGDSLMVEISDKAGKYRGETMVVLTDAGSDNAGEIVITAATAVTDVTSLQLPKQFVLHQNYPNPFNPETMISFGLPKISHVKIQIFDISGRLVLTLVDRTVNSGYHQVTWKGQDQFGKAVGSGIYFCRMEASDYQSTMKLIFAK